MRNGICHGLIGISAARGDMPATLMWEINNEKHSVSWEDLQVSFSWLARLPRAFQMISNPSLERLGSRAINNIENRDWWMAEFDLNLPKE